MDQISFDIVFWNMALGVASSAVWEGIKFAWGSFSRGQRQEQLRAFRPLPFIRNAVLVAIALTVFVILTSTPAYYLG